MWTASAMGQLRGGNKKLEPGVRIVREKRKFQVREKGMSHSGEMGLS